MTGQLLKRQYKIFCVGGPNSINQQTEDSGCEWETKRDSNDSLWLKHVTCPKCDGNTDAIELR